MSLHSESSFVESDPNDDSQGVGQDTTKQNSNKKKDQTDGSDEKERFVQKESLYVLLLRVAVFLVLLTAAVAVSIVVFKITDNAESEEFESDFDAAAHRVMDTFTAIASEKMGAAASLEVAIVAHGVDHKRQWPFVALSSFQQRSSEVMRRSGALFVGIVPLVLNKYRQEWEDYSNHDIDASWYDDGRTYQKDVGIDDYDTRPQVRTGDPDLEMEDGVPNHIFSLERKVAAVATITPTDQYYLPMWQTSPVARMPIVNQDYAGLSEAAYRAIEEKAVVFDGMESSEPGYASDSDPVTAEFAWLLHVANRKETMYQGDIFTSVYFPLFSNFTSNRSAVGAMRIVIQWARYFRNILPTSTVGVVVVLNNQCDEPYTFMINGEDVVLLGHGDRHETRFDKYKRSASFAEVASIADGTEQGLDFYQDQCIYTIDVYPSEDFYSEYNSNTPTVITVSVAVVFAFMVAMFFLYDRLVEWRQTLMLKKATQTHEIVASLFPKAIRDRMLKDAKGVAGQGGPAFKAFLRPGDAGVEEMDEAAIADLYPNATILFADLSGFTAWSSTREPTQVFTLLQKLYQAFDEIAARRNVFKVETVGDCYVAAAGLPKPRPDHALAMTRFAFECLTKTKDITRDLETTLGPDTGDLSIRVGLNSGPVIAGVLRGERSRFQLFGDTVNTASRMESTGIPGKIQVSQTTADILTRHGKGHWVTKREDDVLAKGKGVLRTYWVTPRSQNSSTSSSNSHNNGTTELAGPSFAIESQSLLKHTRLIDWMAEILQDYVRQIGIKHKATTKSRSAPVSFPPNEEGKLFVDEVVYAIKLPTLDADFDRVSAKYKDEVLSDEIKKQLHEYVTIIASTYRNNPFHSFEHACHVTMNVCKFLKRMVAADRETDQASKSSSSSANDWKAYTHEINTDPSTAFAIVFSAMIHDVDHRGVSNKQFIKEEPNIGAYFRERSPLEQNSLAIAWNLLLSDQFRRLRNFLFATPEDFKIFRQIVVNSVMATDIFDKEANDMRKNKWSQVFGDAKPLTLEQSRAERNDVKATIVMEYVIQASDVCHTMQHWHVYRKWNKRLFHEQLVAYRAGRLGSDPAKNWYQGELNFFDKYVIPLAKKLEECQVFGVSSDECLNYALRNRDEWDVKGQQMVEEMMEEFQAEQD